MLKGMDDWRLVSNNVWGCEDNPGRVGKSDFLFQVPRRQALDHGR